MNANLESEILYIKKIMNDSRKSALDNGKYYILWGVLIGISCIANYYVFATKTDINPNYIWFPFIAIGWAFSIYWGYKDSKREKTLSLGKKVISAVWGACGLASIVIAVPAQISGTIHGSAICALVTTIFGIGYLVAGVVYSDKMLVTLAFIWWAAASYMFFVKGIEILLIYGLFLLIFQVIPGFVLNAKWRKELMLNNA